MMARGGGLPSPQQVMQAYLYPIIHIILQERVSHHPEWRLYPFLKEEGRGEKGGGNRSGKIPVVNPSGKSQW